MSTEGQGGPASRRPMPPSIPPRPAMPSIPPRPATPSTPPTAASGATTAPAPRRHWGRRCGIAGIVVVAIAAVVAVSTWLWVSHRIQHVDALSGAPATPGQTYLIVGSDSRDGWKYDDGTMGARTDTIMVLHRAPNGVTSLISIPRDSYVPIPGHDPNKINAAFALGGARLLVGTVEDLTGLTLDAYLEIGLTGVPEVVDALGGVELCYDSDVDDWRSKFHWTAGCHTADGDTALAFSRMRYSDPEGDIGRAARQRQLVSAVAGEVFTRRVMTNPFLAKKVAAAGLAAFRVDDGAGPADLARIALAFRAATGGEAVTGTPPIKDWGYHVKGIGSTVLLDPDALDQFWVDVAQGTFAPGSEVGGLG